VYCVPFSDAANILMGRLVYAFLMNLFGTIGGKSTFLEI
jgi:hypothetical protein